MDMLIYITFVLKRASSMLNLAKNSEENSKRLNMQGNINMIMDDSSYFYIKLPPKETNKKQSIMQWVIRLIQFTLVEMYMEK